MVRKLKHIGLPNCYKLSNGTVEVIVTTEIGPRVVHYGFKGAGNILGLCPPGAKVKTELGIWKPIGGHRLWTAPEGIPRSYVPDSSPIDFDIEGNNEIRLIQPIEKSTGIRKEMTVKLAGKGTKVTLLHSITNTGLWAIEVSPWALSIMDGGGSVIIPQEPYRSHDEYLLPARPMVLWHYTDLSDPRFTIGKRYLRLRTDESLAEPQKVGVADKQGWAGYYRKGTLFVKQFGYEDGALYPDGGCNCETYTAASFIELESVGPLCVLEPGESAEHVEIWHLFKDVDLGMTEEAMDAALCPIITKLPAL